MLFLLLGLPPSFFLSWIILDNGLKWPWNESGPSYTHTPIPSDHADWLVHHVPFTRMKCVVDEIVAVRLIRNWMVNKNTFSQKVAAACCALSSYDSTSRLQLHLCCFDWIIVNFLFPSLILPLFCVSLSTSLSFSFFFSLSPFPHTDNLFYHSPVTCCQRF